MEETKPEIEWHKFKDAHIAMRGDQILFLVERIPDFPCEAYGIAPQQGMYSNLEAAKAEAEAGHARFLKHQAQHEGPPPNDFYIDILKGVVAALESKVKKPE